MSTTTSFVPSSVRTCLEAFQLEILEFEPGSTPTAETAAAKIGVEVGRIAKSILFKGKDGSFRMVVLAGDRRINNNRLKRATGFKHRMTSAEETLMVTGYRPGGVCPFALENRDVDILLDSSLFQFDIIYPAAGTDATGVPLSPEMLKKITGGRKVEVANDPNG